MAELRANDLVMDVQPNFIHQIFAEPLPAVTTTPDDPYVSVDGTTWSEGSFGNAFPDLYGIRNLHVLETWSLLDTNGNGVFDGSETGPGEGVVVAVIDTGLDVSHPDIAGVVFVNPGEIPGDAIDNDGNGMVDDVSGWDLVHHDAIPEDFHGHGTQVAGTIAAASNNAEGIVGVAPFAKILPIKAFNDEGFASSAVLAAAVDYAVAVGADITSNSWGGLFVDPLIEAAFDNAEASGVLSFAAAGNSSQPFVSMPALYSSVVGVAAVDELAGFSNWGLGIEICAPGVSVLSLSANEHDNVLVDLTGRRLGDHYIWLNGTSMATPYASGAAALVMSLHPSESAAEIRGRLAAGAVSIDAQNPGREEDLGAGRVDTLASATVVPTSLLRPVAIRASAIVAGEPALVDVEVRNFWASGTGVHASLTSTDPGVSIVDGERDYGDLSTGESASRRFEIQITQHVEFGEEHELVLTISADGTPMQAHVFTVRGSFFENKDSLANIDPFPLYASGATFGDYDGDGLQDMGIGTAFRGTRLYRHELDGTFSFHEPNGSGFIRFPIFADMNRDGRLDMLAVGPSVVVSGVLSINIGGGHFEVLPESSGFKFPKNSQLTGMTPIDLEGDGHLDFVAGTFSLFRDDEGTWRNMVVLRNNGDLTFSDVWAETEFGRLAGGHQYLSFDWNADGFQDLFALNRYPNRVSLHRNLGKGKFEDVTDTAFPDEFLRCEDWAQDILAPVGSFVGEVGGLMRNLAGGDDNWLVLELSEVDSAPNGYGARVNLVADGRVHTREIHYSPVEPWQVHVGLGDATVVSVLEVRWPSGVVGIRRDVAVNQRFSVDEGLPCPDLAGGQCPTVEIDIDPKSDANRVVTDSNGLLNVAVLGSDDFDVANADSSSFFFGPGRARPAHKQGAHVEACVRGQMLDRTPFSGCDLISTKGKKKAKK